MLKKSQVQIENELSDALPHGMREEIAKGTGIYPKIVDAYFNANDERKSPHFTVLHIQAVLDEKAPEIAEVFWQKFLALREASKPRNAKRAALNIDHELGELSKEFTDVIVAKCEGKPVEVQMREIAEARRQLDRYETALTGEGVN